MLTFKQYEDLFGKAFSMYLLEAYLGIFSFILVVRVLPYSDPRGHGLNNYIFKIDYGRIWR